MKSRGPCWPPRFPPHKRWEHIPPTAIRELFRQVFVRWGLPDRIRVDNGYPWGTTHDLPSELALWLIGLGVEPIWNPPARPTRNAKVERSNGLTRQWGEPQACDGPRSLARALAEVCRIQREEYPGQRGRTRLEAFPGLAEPRRGYRRSGEKRSWDLSRVDEFLSRAGWIRRVGRNGTVALYAYNRSVGRAHAGQDVGVRFISTNRNWVITDSRGGWIKDMAAPELSRERILAMDVSRRKGVR